MIGAIFTWFSTSKWGKWVAGFGVLALFCLWFYSWVASNGKLQTTVAIQDASIEEIQRQNEVARDAIREDNERADQAQEDQEADEARIDTFKEEISLDEDADVIVLSVDDVERLRDLDDLRSKNGTTP